MKKPFSISASPTAELVPLPARGGDPVWGQSRAWWLRAERAGLIQLVNRRVPGSFQVGLFLPVAEARALFRPFKPAPPQHWS